MTWVLLRIFVWGAIMAGLGFLCYNGGNIPLTILAFVVSVIFAVAEIDEYRDRRKCEKAESAQGAQAAHP